jgi:hypothetical protein
LNRIPYEKLSPGSAALEKARSAAIASTSRRGPESAKELPAADGRCGSPKRARVPRERRSDADGTRSKIRETAPRPPREGPPAAAMALDAQGRPRAVGIVVVAGEAIDRAVLVVREIERQPARSGESGARAVEASTEAGRRAASAAAQIATTPTMRANAARTPGSGAAALAVNFAGDAVRATA